MEYQIKEELHRGFVPYVVNVQNGASMCYLPNLYPDNVYVFSVVSNGQVVAQGEFNVEGPVRMIYAPSVYNLRDLGGWTVQDGRKVRYGLLYRGGEVNGYHAPVFDDLKTLMSNEINIGAEISHSITIAFNAVGASMCALLKTLIQGGQYPSVNLVPVVSNLR